MSLYAQDGVNVAEGDDFSSFASTICSQTHGNSRFVKIHDFSRGHFRGPRGIQFTNLPTNCFFDAAPDGIGTKVSVITAALSQYTAACDVLAMTCGDISRWGGLTLFFSNVLDVASLGKSGDQTNMQCREVMKGLVEVAMREKIVIYKGETAELGSCVGSENPEASLKFNWAGFAFGVYDPTRMITGDTLKPGQIVIALEEKGFRSNGISSVRKALRQKFGDQWWNNPKAESPIHAAATPSKLYDGYLEYLNGWTSAEFKRNFPIHAVIHITGGGIKSKLGEDILFPRGLSAELFDLWDPPVIMKQCAEWRGCSDEESYSTWNGGQGVLIVVDPENSNQLICSAEEFGINAKVCGKITSIKTPRLRITSRFSNRIFDYCA